MAKRKRAREESPFHEVQESFQEMTVLQHSFTSSSSSSVNEDATDLPRRSPESVLYESPQVDLLQCHQELSPEIIPKISRVKLKPKYSHEDDEAVEVGEEAVTREIQQSALFGTQQDLLMCHEQLSPEIVLEISQMKKLDPRAENNDVRKAIPFLFIWIHIPFYIILSFFYYKHDSQLHVSYY